MIPRYAPTYTVKDLINGLKLSYNPDININLNARLKSLYDVQHVFLFGSGREALFAVLRAYNRPGSVLIPAYNCIVVPEAIQFAGYNPVFVDIDKKSLSMTVEGVKKAINNEVRAVFLTHIFGIPCQIKEILSVLHKQDILIIEDAAPALGAEYEGQMVGCFGDASVISFQSTKVISGEAGGVLLTNNETLAQKVKDLLLDRVAAEKNWKIFFKALTRKFMTSQRIYGLTQFGYRVLQGEKMHEIVTPQFQKPKGFFSRCPTLASALVSLQLDRLKWNLERRRNLGLLYRNELSTNSKLTLPAIPNNCNPSWIQFPIFVEDKEVFYKHMQRHHIDVTWTYRYSCAESYRMEGFPNAQNAARNLIGLPTNPFITDKQAMDICQVANHYR